MAEVLKDHLRVGASTRFQWGSNDCCMWVCDWIRKQRAVDPAFPFREKYKTQAGCGRIILRYGSLEKLVRSAFESAGLLETTDPAPGDVGLVMTMNGMAMAIKTQTGWACKAPKGLTVSAQFPCVVAWAI